MPPSVNPWQSHNISLRWILVVPFVVQIFAAVGLTGWISFQNSQKAVNDLARQLRHEIAARIDQKLTDHLDNALIVTQINVDATQSGQLNLDDSEQARKYLLAQLGQFPMLSGITVATETPAYAGLVRSPQGRLIFTRWNRQDGGIIDYYLTDLGAIDSISEIGLDYDHRQRPWYADTVASGQPLWQSPYVTLNPSRLVISIDRPFYNEQGDLQGVSDAELSLSAISDFLRELDISKTGKVLILEKNGYLVATSTLEQPFRINRSTGESERLHAQDSSNPVIQETVQLLDIEFAGLENITGTHQLDLTLGKQRNFVQVVPFNAYLGLDWLVVIIVPESNFMATIHRNNQITAMLCLMALLLATGIGLLTASWLVRPIQKITAAADALAQGSWQQPIPNAFSGELTLLARAFNQMSTQLRQSFTELEYNANHDNLTGLLNRPAFHERLQAVIDIQNTGDNPGKSQPIFGVFFLDLDDFKLANDSFGHVVGDQLLIAMSRRLQNLLRSESSLSNHSAIARFGGDEFVMLIHPLDTAFDAGKMADKVLACLKQPFTLGGIELFVNTSIGIVLSPLGGSCPEDFIRNSDIALYRAKNKGKAGYEVFDIQMHRSTVARLKIETDLHRALKNQELELYYQPIVNTFTCEISGFEALLRWHHPERGFISPTQFIPIAEESSLMLDIGWWVLGQACGQARLWQQTFDHCQSLVMNVNLSSKQLFQVDYLAQIETILANTAFNPNGLALEITESTFIKAFESTDEKLQRLRKLGIALSIDDFGTGYSSLSYLSRFPFNTLKIDRSFIQSLGNNADQAAIVEAIILLGHKLGLEIVAEGVETLAQYHWLQQQGCDKIQGYLFLPAMNAKTITTLLQTGRQLPLTNDIFGHFA